MSEAVWLTVDLQQRIVVQNCLDKPITPQADADYNRGGKHFIPQYTLDNNNEGHLYQQGQHVYPKYTSHYRCHGGDISKEEAKAIKQVSQMPACDLCVDAETDLEDPDPDNHRSR